MGENSWHEVARPQVHGHDINCVTIIQGKGNHRFVSGADEKVARVFEAPLSFLKTLNHATFQESSFHEDLQADVQILGANMSALGLSQKPIYVNGKFLFLSDKCGLSRLFGAFLGFFQPDFILIDYDANRSNLLGLCIFLILASSEFMPFRLLC